MSSSHEFVPLIRDGAKTVSASQDLRDSCYLLAYKEQVTLVYGNYYYEPKSHSVLVCSPARTERQVTHASHAPDQTDSPVEPMDY